MTARPGPDWKDLQPFLALARTGSFAAASRRLGNRHSMISRRIDALEQALKTGARSTNTGIRVLPIAEAHSAQCQVYCNTAQCAEGVAATGLTGLSPEVLVRQPVLSVFRRDMANDPQGRQRNRCIVQAVRRVHTARLGGAE